MNKSFLPTGYSLRKVTEVDLLIADYMTNNFDDEIGETNTVWLHEEIKEYWDAPQDDEEAECYFIVDPDGNPIGYAKIYCHFEEDVLVSLEITS